jgi:hypothetical protein
MGIEKVMMDTAIDYGRRLEGDVANLKADNARLRAEIAGLRRRVAEIHDLACKIGAQGHTPVPDDLRSRLNGLAGVVGTVAANVAEAMAREGDPANEHGAFFKAP